MDWVFLRHPRRVILPVASARFGEEGRVTRALQTDSEGNATVCSGRPRDIQNRQSTVTFSPPTANARDSLAEIGGEHLRGVEQQRGFAVQRDLAAFHYVAALAGLRRQPGVLLDQQDGHALRSDGADDFENLLDHERRQAHRWLIGQRRHDLADRSKFVKKGPERICRSGMDSASGAGGLSE